MQYLYQKEAGREILSISGEEYKYLFRVRRFKIGDMVSIRNLRDDFLYSYQIVTIDRREAHLKLLTKEERKIETSSLHIGWCLIDPKVIEKHLHILNEVGVEKISFIYCDRSQKNFKLNFQRLEKILINSSMQCGRAKMLQLEIIDSIDEYIKRYKDIVVIDFCNNLLQDNKNIKNFLVGPEGGFSSREKAILRNFDKRSFKIKTILRSETAVIFATSLIIA